MPKEGYVHSKTALLAVQEILKQYSSYENTLSKKQIAELAESRYQMKPSRNTVADSVNALVEFYGEEVVHCGESERRQSDGEKAPYTYGWFWDREETEDMLTDEEIASLIDVCMYARNLKAKEAKNLIGRLKRMATVSMQKKLEDYIGDIPEKQFNINPGTTDNIRRLRELVSKNKKRSQHWISFDFNYYSSEHERQLSQYSHVTVLPLGICEANHKYYLLCALENSKEKIYHYRIDLMTHIKEQKHKTVDGMEELKKRLAATDLSDYMSSHLYMFYDEPRQIDLSIPKDDSDANLTFLVDAFGVHTRWRLIKETEDAVVVRLCCSPKALKILIMQYAQKGLRVDGPEAVKHEIDDMIKEDCERLLKSLQAKGER